MKSGALGDWHLYFVISTEALMYEVRSGEIIDTELYKRMRVIKKELYTAPRYRANPFAWAVHLKLSRFWHISFDENTIFK